MTIRIKCVIEYDGTAYVGFQLQPNGLSIQEVLEKSLGGVLGHPVRIVSASRTDAGVHANGQVIAFDTSSAIPTERLSRVVNDHLPADIRILKCEAVSAEFHPRYDAHRKKYQYLIYRTLAGSAFWQQRAWVYLQPLEWEKMQKSAAKMVGCHDMTSFCAAGSAVKDKVRTIDQCYWQEDGPIWTLNMSGDGFVYHQVRNMVGTMIEIGRGFWEPDYIDFLFQNNDRTLAGPTAPAAGLYLQQVIY